MRSQSPWLIVVVAGVFMAGCGPRRAPAARASDGDVLRLTLSYEPDSLDPHRHKRLSDFAIASNFYEPLVSSDADGGLKPGLALRWETPDPLTWIFHLRPGVRFHSGRTLTADDVVYSLERLRQGQDLELSSYLQDVTSVRAIDPLTVEVRTREATGILVAHLRFVMIIPKGSGPHLESTVDGTGPYRLEAWEPPGLVRGVRFEDYWGAKPAFARFEESLAATPDQAIEDVLAGRSQLVRCASRSAFEKAASRADLRGLTGSSVFVVQLGYDLKNEDTPFCSVRPNPFRNLLVRQALDLAVDRPALVSRLAAFAVPAYQPVPASVFGHSTRVPAPKHDPEAARALLARAGLRDGFDVTLHTRKQFLDAATIVQEQLAVVGVRVKLAPLPDPEFLEFTSQHRASFFLSRWGQLTGDAGEMLDSSVHTSDPRRHLGALNFGGYSNPELDRRIDALRSLSDSRRRGAALESIVTQLAQNLVWIPLYVDQQAYLMSAGLSWQPRSDSLVLPAEVKPVRAGAARH